MSRFRTKAERMFRDKATAAIANNDWATVERVYGQYGAYLELTETVSVDPYDLAGSA